jgi:hypothetical protein
MVSPLVYDESAPSNRVPFASFTLNVGEQSICGAHIDGINLAAGLCFASPFGKFDYTKGGHLILHELRIVLEVPPGSFVLFPSAIITHENIPISEGESRQSITGFTPGIMFQWVENGFRRINQMPRPKQHSHKLKPSTKSVKLTRSPSKVWSTMTQRFPHITTLF